MAKKFLASREGAAEGGFKGGIPPRPSGWILCRAKRGSQFRSKKVRAFSNNGHQKGNCKFERFASRSLSRFLRDSATNLYSILGVKTNSRFRILGEENFLIL